MPTPPDTPYALTGTSPAVRECLERVRRAAEDDRGVLLTAAPGLDTAGVARAIHAASRRRSGPFVALPCDGLTAAEVERALFGAPYRAGPNALEVGPAGALARASGGVLFLPNVMELPAALQRRLARVLRGAEVRVPRRRAVAVDVRLIAAREPGAADPLREDLVSQLPVTIHVPALRERRGDVPAIAEAMLAARDRNRRFTAAALTVLAALPWRRNTAELARLIERLAGAGGGEAIRQEDVLAEAQLERVPLRMSGSLREARREFEREYIAAVLRDHEWHMPRAARALGIERANLYRKARQLGIRLRPRPATPASRSAG